MEPDFCLFDSYQWFVDVVSLPVDEAGLCLFSHLGFVDEDASPLLPAKGARSFVYSLLPEGHILSDSDRHYMESLKLGSLLFQLRSSDYPEVSENINVYAVELEDVDYERSEVAYGVHCLISKFSDSRCIVLFRHRDAIMLSFLYPLEESLMSIYLSDWLTLDTPDIGQFEKMHVASTSLKSARECCDGLAFEAIRAYYKYPPSNTALWYAYMDALNIDQEEYYGSPWEDAIEFASALKLQYVNQYGDDYIEGKVTEVEYDDDFNIDDIEWELQTAEEREDGFVSNDNPDQEPDLIGLTSSNKNIPARVLEDPIALLEWINNHEFDVPEANDGKPSKHASKNLVGSYHEVPWNADLQGIEPKVGSHVRHRSLGIGTVTHVGQSNFSAAFGKTSRLFVYPYAFEKGITVLLRSD